MSNYKIFKQYTDDLKTLSKVVNKFDFNELAETLLFHNAKGNFAIFEPANVLDKSKRYAFLSFAIQHLYVGGHKLQADKMSDLRLVRLIKTLFELPEHETQVKTYQGREDGKSVWREQTQIGLKNLLKLWQKATDAKAKAIELQAKKDAAKAKAMQKA